MNARKILDQLDEICKNVDAWNARFRTNYGSQVKASLTMKHGTLLGWDGHIWVQIKGEMLPLHKLGVADPNFAAAVAHLHDLDEALRVESRRVASRLNDILKAFATLDVKRAVDDVR